MVAADIGIVLLVVAVVVAVVVVAVAVAADVEYLLKIVHDTPPLGQLAVLVVVVGKDSLSVREQLRQQHHHQGYYEP